MGAVAVFLVVAVAAGLFVGVQPSSASGTTRVAADDAHAMARDGRLTIIDVRTKREQMQTGLPADAIPIGIAHDGGEAGFVAEISAAVGGDRDRQVALICARGSRSDRAAEILRANGFTKVIDIHEGMLGNRAAPGWLTRNLPVSPLPEILPVR